jgi:hypothetical protein
VHAYQMEHVFSYDAQLRAPEVIGPVGTGIRINFHVEGGEIRGPRLSGRVLPVGADWLTLQHDGIAVLDVRATLQAGDGALIDVAYSGLGDLGGEGYAAFLRGELPPGMTLRTVPRFSSAHPAHAWMNRLQFVGIGEVDFARQYVSYDVYALR